jgi:S-adenosylmethionine hydrolase
MTQFSTSLPSHSVIALMTDFGIGDGDVGVLKGVMLSIAPQVQMVDITHDVAPQHVASGAWILAAAYRYFPKGTVYLCVVDPGVGSKRLPIAVHAGNWFFVGPDNGLFSYIYAEQEIYEAVAITDEAYHLSDTSYTFHGRDIFAPIAAHITRGVPLAEMGPTLDPATLTRLDTIAPQRWSGKIPASIVHVDHFGNLITNIPLRMVPDLFSSPQVQLTFSAQHFTLTERKRFFSEGDTQSTAPFIFGDSSGYVGVAVRNGSAAQTINAGYGAAITFVIGEK